MPLHVQGEHELPVPPLEMPRDTSVEAVAACEAAVALALILMLYRRSKSLDVSLWQDLRDADQEAIVDEEPLPPPPPSPPLPQLTPSGKEPLHPVEETSHV